MENSESKKVGFIDKIFIPSLWILSIAAAVLITILYLKIDEKSRQMKRTESSYKSILMQNVQSHQYFLDMTMRGYMVQPTDTAIIEYGLKVLQNLEEMIVLTPFTEVHDTARTVKERYLEIFPMLKDSIQRLDFESGDIVVRHNNSFHSELFRNMSSGERRYSHVGIIRRITPDSLIVYHSVANDFTGVGGIITEPLYNFMPRGDFDVAVYRVDAPQQVRKEIFEHVMQMQEQQVPFDLFFDIDDTSRIYCAELIAVAVNRSVGYPLITPSGTFMGKRVYTIEDCYRFPGAKLVYRRQSIGFSGN